MLVHKMLRLLLPLHFKTNLSNYIYLSLCFTHHTFNTFLSANFTASSQLVRRQDVLDVRWFYYVPLEYILEIQQMLGKARGERLRVKMDAGHCQLEESGRTTHTLLFVGEEWHSACFFAQQLEVRDALSLVLLSGHELQSWSLLKYISREEKYETMAVDGLTVQAFSRVAAYGSLII